MVNTSLRRPCVVFLTKAGRSVRRACELVGMSRSGFSYLQRRQIDPELIERIKAIAKKYVRFGYRRTWAVLRREGIVVNHKAVYRIRKSLGLTLPRRKARKPRPGTAQLPCQAAYRNHVWTYDFLFDSLADGKQLKFLTVVDEFTRVCLKIEVGTSIRSGSVITILEGLFREHGAPRFLRSDNGPEFIAKELRTWLGENGSQTMYIDRGSPWQNAVGESFNGKLRDEFLTMNVFYTLAEARILTEGYRRFYNSERPHSSLHYLTPMEFRAGVPPRALSNRNHKQLKLAVGTET